ncbi:MAG: TetR/AcrR family transcriptional regulator [Chloroflexota bacterium]
MEAAYERIADAGFEGLRTRDVAADVGVNVATLHYYFPTKEALIRGVVGHALRKFGATMPNGGSAAEQLGAHLAAIHRLLKEEPGLFAVLGELALRAPRDAVIADVLRAADEPWHRVLRELVRHSVQEGRIDPRVDPDDAAALIAATIRGVSMPAASSVQPERIDGAFRELDRWLGLAGGNNSSNV